MGLTFSLVLALAGHAYVIDHGLTAEDCAAERKAPPVQVRLVDMTRYQADYPSEAIDVLGALSCQPE